MNCRVNRCIIKNLYAFTGKEKERKVSFSHYVGRRVNEYFERVERARQCQRAVGGGKGGEEGGGESCQVVNNFT